jgi:AcrR family transcriptional regulator
MSKTVETGRKTRILDAAEKAFAEFGFNGASLRTIVTQARVNLATVYYYFESKEGLMAAVFNRRFDPLRQEHLALLKAFVAESNDQPLPVEKVIEAMVVPPLRLATAAPVNSQVVMRLIGRIVTEPNQQIQVLLRNQFADVREAFLAAFSRSLPELPRSDLLWRYEFVWGALAFTLCNPRKREREAGGICNLRDTPTVISQMKTFFAAGFHAPALTVE